MLSIACTKNNEFNKDCDLCKQINQNEVETCLNNFVYNNKTLHISKEAQTQLLEKNETLRHGHKFIACGCRENKLIYRLWCANNETFELELKIIGNKQFSITGIQEAEFSHP